MGSFEAATGVTGNVVLAGAWPLIRAGDIAKHPAPADHLEALKLHESVREDDPSGNGRASGDEVVQVTVGGSYEFKPASLQGAEAAPLLHSDLPGCHGFRYGILAGCEEGCRQSGFGRCLAPHQGW